MLSPFGSDIPIDKNKGKSQFDMTCLLTKHIIAKNTNFVKQKKRIFGYVMIW